MTPRPRSLEEQRASFDAFVAHRRSVGDERLVLVEDGPARIVDADGERTVALFFAHRDFPAIHFGYHAKPLGEDPAEEVWLVEELATGALHRLMRDDPPVPDRAGITWIRLLGQRLRAAT